MTDVVKVPASKSGTTVLVSLDPPDAAWLGARKLSIGSHGYAQVYDGGKVCLLHRVLLGLTKGDGRIGDHKNGDPLDNRRSNLRVVDAVASSCNGRGWSSTGYRGVYRSRFGKPFEARAKVAGKVTLVGRFDTAEEADEAVHQWRLANMPGYVDRPGARRVGEMPDPDIDTMWWQVLETAGARRWSLSTLGERFTARMGVNYDDPRLTGRDFAEFLTALKAGEVR